MMNKSISRRNQGSTIPQDTHDTLKLFDTTTSFYLNDQVLNTPIRTHEICDQMKYKTYPVIITNLRSLASATNSRRPSRPVRPSKRIDRLILLDTTRLADSEPLVSTTLGDGGYGEGGSNLDFDIYVTPNWDIALDDYSPEALKDYTEYISNGGKASTLGLKLDAMKLTTHNRRSSKDYRLKQTFSECILGDKAWSTEVKRDGAGFTSQVMADLGTSKVKLVYGDGDEYREHTLKLGERAPISMTLFFKLTSTSQPGGERCIRPTTPDTAREYERTQRSTRGGAFGCGTGVEGHGMDVCHHAEDYEGGAWEAAYGTEEIEDWGVKFINSETKSVSSPGPVGADN